MTAIAAVLAFATPALAQDATSVTPDVPVATPDNAADPVLVVEPAAESAPAADPLAVTPEATATPEAAAPAASPRATQTPRTNTRPVRQVRPAFTERAPTPTPRGDLPPAAPTAIEPDAPVAMIAAPLAVAPAAEVPAPRPTEQIATDDMLPIAGAAGLGLLALIGGGAAMRRRKRRAENAEIDSYDEPRFGRSMPPPADVAPVRQPAMTETPAVPPIAASTAAVGRKIDAPATKLPAGFDLSRFGPHVQAAYRGPTEDNPSLSLKNRLRRAGAMDQMADKNEEAPILSTTTQDEGAFTNKVARAKSAEAGFMLGSGKAAPKLNPILQN